MKTLSHCKCGNNIIRTNPKSFKVINRQRLCPVCATNPDIFRIVQGSRSFFPTAYHAARFDTICSLQRAAKVKQTYVDLLDDFHKLRRTRRILVQQS